ncbi:MAG: flagellar hook-basal body protein [Lachnospiraceae bacterium]|jgi:flagellar basal-body rod protein FlgG|nr:flagellar hook-basal body protein [Lachnospiraceae bacterium]MCI8871249.1 flagellar hook-basal body protein [Lachnospiraceae bacterium]GFI31757.1 flagellar basal-body rod protein FlgG [Lachnospiraceae bacterium]
MMRSLWSAASGMISQQTAVDTIAHNLSNVNTTGYKTEKTEFKSLLYQTLQTRTTTANGENKPISAQVGLGTRVASITSNFTQGSMLSSESFTSMAIAGDGFFSVRGADGNTYYTRNGDFKLSVGDNGDLTLVTADGYPVLDAEGNPITMPGDVSSSKIQVSTEGAFGYLDGNGNFVNVANIGLYQFSNPAGLEKLSNSLLAVTDASGAALNEANTANLIRSEVRQKYVEGSNVQVADEMVNLIVAQRAYEMNSKAIQAADDMLGQANQLKR